MNRCCVLVVLIACGSSRKDTPSMGSGSAPAPVVVDAPVAIDAAIVPIDAAVAADFTGYPPRIERPTTGCTLSGAWKDQSNSLRFAIRTTPFATMFDVKRADVTFVGPIEVFAELTTETLRLHGFVDPSLVSLYAPKPMLVDGWIAPGPTLPFRFKGITGDNVKFEVVLPKTIRAKNTIAERPCTDLAIETVQFDPHDAIDTEPESQSRLKTDRDIPVSLEPGKPPVGWIRSSSGAFVEVLEKKDKLVRAMIEPYSMNPAEKLVIVGWIAANAIDMKPTGFGGSWATGGGRGMRRGPPRRDTKFVKCASETPLAAYFAGDQRTVGVILPSTIIEVFPNAKDGFAEVRFPRGHAELTEGARWLVKETALAGCSETAAP